MTDQDNYRPRSPDFRTPPTAEYPLASPLDCAPYNYNTSPFFARQYHPPSGVPQPYIPPFTEAGFDSDMARRSSRLAPPPDTKYMDPVLPEEPPRPSPAAGIEVKTKFPVARIKRIMQADEDVGKVAQVTPIAVSKALELFMISLVTKAAKEAKDRNSKRVTASHLKQAVVNDEVLDFLADIIAKVPDQPGGGRKHEDDGSDQNEQPKRKRGGRRPKDDSD